MISFMFLFFFVFKVSHNLRIRVTGTTKWVHSPDCHRLKWSLCRVFFPFPHAVRRITVDLRDQRTMSLMFFCHWKMLFWNPMEKLIPVISQTLSNPLKTMAATQTVSRTPCITRKFYCHPHRITITTNATKINLKMVMGRTAITTPQRLAQVTSTIRPWALTFPWIWRCMDTARGLVHRWLFCDFKKLFIYLIFIKKHWSTVFYKLNVA